MSVLAELLSSRARAGVFHLLFGLRHGELHVRALARQSGLHEATVRQELRKLKALDLVEERRDGNRAYFSAKRRSSPVRRDPSARAQDFRARRCPTGRTGVGGCSDRICLRLCRSGRRAGTKRYRPDGDRGHRVARTDCATVGHSGTGRSGRESARHDRPRVLPKTPSGRSFRDPRPEWPEAVRRGNGR